MQRPAGNEAAIHSSRHPWIAPLVTLAGFWIAGILLGKLADTAGGWTLLSGLLALIALVTLLRGRGGQARRWGLLAVLAVSAAWSGVRRQVPADHVAQFLSQQPQLIGVVGTIEGEPQIRPAQTGAFASFSYAGPVTIGVLRLASISVDRRDRSCSGKLLVKIAEADYRLRDGIVIRATGWLSAIEGPMNPGERDFRSILTNLGLNGRFTLPKRGNWQIIPPDFDSLPPENRLGTRVRRWRKELSRAAATTLRAGMAEHPRRLALLETILLGRRLDHWYELAESFRRVGLAHLLSISGAHLGILLGLVWWGIRILTGRPTVSALAVLVVLVLFLMVVPWRVPIVRAAIMALLFALGYGSGRRPAGLAVLALAAVVVLIWRPSDLFSAGFQLSFGAVAGLILFARRVGQWIWAAPRPELMGGLSGGWSGWWWWRIRRWFVDYLAANLVAFAIVVPLVAFHFQLVTPLAIVLSIFALPLVVMMLGIGYAKVLLGMLYPSLSPVLAGPLTWFTNWMMGLVDHAAQWPGVTIELPTAPSIIWVIGAVALVLAVLSGRFAKRRLAMSGAIGICLIWMVLSADPTGRTLRTIGLGRDPPLRVSMLAVGDGSCYLVQIAPRDAEPQTIMFDCGSQRYLSVGLKTVLPVLRYFGIRRLDTLVISHADLDHYGGALDVMDQVPIGRVLFPAYLLAEARRDETSAAAFLVKQLRATGARTQTIGRGWSQRHGSVELEALWPPADLIDPGRNDTSIVLRIQVGDRRLMLCGDIQQKAITQLLDEGTDLQADVCDLPHHGSFVEASPRWLQAVAPQLVLQSSGIHRLRFDKWRPWLEPLDIQRYVTARDGMVQVTVDNQGQIAVSTFKLSDRQSNR